MSNNQEKKKKKKDNHPNLLIIIIIPKKNSHLFKPKKEKTKTYIMPKKDEKVKNQLGPHFGKLKKFEKATASPHKRRRDSSVINCNYSSLFYFLPNLVG